MTRVELKNPLKTLLPLKWRAVKHTAQFPLLFSNSSLDQEVLQCPGPQYICASEWTPGRFISFLLRRQRQNQSGRRWRCTLGMQIARGYSHKTTLRKLWATGRGYTLRMFKSYQLLSCIIMLQVRGKLELIISTQPSVALLLTHILRHIDLCVFPPLMYMC